MEVLAYIVWDIIRSSFVGGQWRPGMVLGETTSTVDIMKWTGCISRLRMECT